MNFTFKPRSTNANALQEHIQGKPLRQDSCCDNFVDSRYLNPSSNQRDDNLGFAPSDQAASIYGGMANSVESVVETPTNSQERSTTPQPAATNTENWSTSLHTVLDQPPSTLPYKLILGGMLFCLAFGAWAWLGQIEEVGHAQGRLVPKGEVYKIDPVEAGKIARIGVKEGQAVKAGQVLVEMNSQLAMSEVERLQQMLASDKIQLSQTQALIDRTRLEAQSRAAIADADFKGQEAAIAEAKVKAATTRELLTQGQTDAAAYQARQERLKPFVEQGALAREQLFEAEQAVRDRQRSITQNQGELEQVLAEANRLQAGLIQKQAEKRTIQLEAQQRIQQMEVEITQLQAKIAETKNLLNNARAKLVERFLYAPVNGVVSSLNIQNIGEVVQPGQTIAQMYPHNVPLVLSANLLNQEAGFVKTGMPVQVKLDAYPYQDYGIVPGKVISISPDAKPDERLGPVYRIEVALDRNYVTAKHQTIKFKAGQTASADIIIRRRRIADILLEPFRQLQKGGIDL